MFCISISVGCIRDGLRFIVQVGHDIMYVSIGNDSNRHFSINNVIIRLTKIMNNLGKDLKILIFEVSTKNWLNLSKKIL